jgi:hypothetical protein
MRMSCFENLLFHGRLQHLPKREGGSFSNNLAILGDPRSQSAETWESFDRIAFLVHVNRLDVEPAIEPHPCCFRTRCRDEGSEALVRLAI